MYFYKYQVYFYDEDSNLSRIAKGITAEVTYVDAMKKIARYYGENAIEQVSLELAVDVLGEAAEDVFEMSNDRVKKGEKA